MFGLGYLVLTTQTFESLHSSFLSSSLRLCYDSPLSSSLHNLPVTNSWNNDSSFGIVTFLVIFYPRCDLSSQILDFNIQCIGTCTRTDYLIVDETL